MNLQRLATSLIILTSLLLLSPPVRAAEVKIPKNFFKITGTGIEYSITISMEASSAAKIKTITGKQILKSSTGKVIVSEDTTFPKKGSSYTAASTYGFVINLTPSQLNALGDKAQLNTEVYDSSDPNKKIRLGGTETPFAVSANVLPDNVAPLKARYTLEEKDGQLTGTVSWDSVKDATHYAITRMNEGKIATIVATSLSSEEITNQFENLEATDKFSVTAYKQGNEGQQIIIAQGPAVAAGVVRARTEFGDLANIGEYVQKVMKYALPVGITLAVIMTMVAGINLILSQGSPDKIKSSKEGIQGAIVGLVILILVRLLVDFLYIPSIDTTPDQPNFFSQQTTLKKGMS
jgi:hypothetical protein